MLSHVRDGGTVAATGGKWAPPWAIALNAGILALHAPYVRDFAGFDRPWAKLAPRVDRLRVQEVAMGGGYLASGTVPARPVPLLSGPIDRDDDRDDEPRRRHPRLTRTSGSQCRRSPAAAMSAAAIAAVGPGRPVISSTWPTAWCSSTSRPPATRQPAAAAAPAGAVGHGA